MAKKKRQPKNEIPLNEDYQEMGQKFEFESDKGREAARKKNRNESKK